MIVTLTPVLISNLIQMFMGRLLRSTENGEAIESFVNEVPGPRLVFTTPKQDSCGRIRSQTAESLLTLLLTLSFEN
jgi:hypothetical protein